MTPDLDALAAALYVTVDDLLAAHPQWAPPRPTVGIAPEVSDAELVTLAVLQASLGFDSEARLVRYAKEHLRSWFPYVPGRSGCNKRLRRSGQLMQHVLGALARDCPSWHDDVWVVDSTPVECGRFLRPLRQIIESVFRTLKAQLGLERHGGRTPAGVAVRVLQRLLALTAAIWHNQTTPRAGPARSLLAYDH